MLHFPTDILWTDEATFTPNGVFNSRNHLLWQDENPHAIREGAYQYRGSINAWAGVIKDRVVNIFVNYKKRYFFFNTFFLMYLLAIFRSALIFYRHVSMHRDTRNSSRMICRCFSRMFLSMFEKL